MRQSLYAPGQNANYVQLLWTVLLMALTGNMVDQWNRGNGGVINYNLFVSIFALLSLLYLIPSAVKESLTFHPIIPLVLDILNTLFWFCGAVATAAKLGAHSCSNQVRIPTRRRAHYKPHR